MGPGSEPTSPEEAPGAPARKIKAMRIATKCTTADEFIQGFFAFVDETSCFIPTLGMRPIGLETAFAIQLVDGTPVLRGIGVILDAWLTADNPFKRPGLRVGVQRLTTDSTAMFERLNAARVAALAIPVAAPAPANDTAPIASTTPVAPAPAPIAAAPVLPRGEEFETPTLETPGFAEAAQAAQQAALASLAAVAAAAAKPTERAPGAAFVLPANPLTSLSDESLGAFVDCMLYEELGEDTPEPEEPIDSPVALASDTPSPAAPPPIPNPAIAALQQQRPSRRDPIATLLGFEPLVAPPRVDPPAVPRTPSTASVVVQTMTPPTVAPVPPTAAPTMVPPTAAPAVPRAVPIGPPTESMAIQGSRSWGSIVGVLLAVLAIAALVWVVAIRSRQSGANAPSGLRSPVTTPTAPRVVVPTPPVTPSTPVIAPKIEPDVKPDVKPTQATSVRPPTTPTTPTPPKSEENEIPSVGEGPCKIMVASSPAGAVVMVDGQVMGPAPITINGPCRQRRVELSSARYAAVMRMVTPTLGKPASLDVTLPRPTHSLKITSIPSGAAVAINGRPAGSTPTKVDVMGYASVTVTLDKYGFKTFSKKVYSTIPVDALTVNLVRKPPGTRPDL